MLDRNKEISASTTGNRAPRHYPDVNFGGCPLDNCESEGRHHPQTLLETSGTFHTYMGACGFLSCSCCSPVFRSGPHLLTPDLIVVACANLRGKDNLVLQIRGDLHDVAHSGRPSLAFHTRHAGSVVPVPSGGGGQRTSNAWCFSPRDSFP